MKRPSGDQSVGTMKPVSGRGSLSGVPSSELRPNFGQLWSAMTWTRRRESGDHTGRCWMPGPKTAFRPAPLTASKSQISALGVKRIRVLNTGISLYNLHARIVSADGGDARTQGPKLGIVNAVQKLPSTRQQLCPGIEPIDGARGSSRSGNHPRVEAVG